MSIEIEGSVSTNTTNADTYCVEWHKRMLLFLVILLADENCGKLPAGNPFNRAKVTAITFEAQHKNHRQFAGVS